MKFRDWHDGDDLRLLELFSDPHNAQHHHDRSMLGPSTQEPFGTGLVAVDDDIPVAAGALRAQAIHPQRMWCYIETAPLQRQRGIATALLNQLFERAPKNTELKTRSAATDLTTASWLTSQGFSPIQHTQRVIVASKSFEPIDIQVQQLATGSVELSKVVAEYYNATHAWDPSDLTLTQAQQMLMQVWNGDARLGIEESDDPDRWVWRLGSPDTELWMDNWAIAAGAPSPEAAHAFINFIMDPEISLRELDYNGYHTGATGIEEAANAEGMDMLDLVFFSPEQIETMHTQILGEQQQRIVDIWNKTKAAAGA